MSGPEEELNGEDLPQKIREGYSSFLRDAGGAEDNLRHRKLYAMVVGIEFANDPAWTDEIGIAFSLLLKEFIDELS